MARTAGSFLRIGALGGLLAFGVTPAIAAGTTVEQSGATASYNLTLDIGPMEQMLTADQAQTQHATSGEIMVAMPGMPMTMATGNHHVEVHVAAKGTGVVVKDATVAITLTDLSNKTVGPVAIQPMMAMYGVVAGQNDWHYGNNAQLPDGAYSAAVTVNGQQASFTSLAVAAAAVAMPTPMATGTTAQMPASSMVTSPAPMPGNAGQMTATAGTTGTASTTQMPAQMPQTGAGGAGNAPGTLLAGLLAAFGVAAAGQRRGRRAGAQTQTANQAAG